MPQQVYPVDPKSDFDARMAALNARLGYREVSRTQTEDGLVQVKLARIDEETL